MVGGETARREAHHLRSLFLWHFSLITFPFSSFLSFLFIHTRSVLLLCYNFHLWQLKWRKNNTIVSLVWQILRTKRLPISTTISRFYNLKSTSTLTVFGYLHGTAFPMSSVRYVLLHHSSYTLTHSHFLTGGLEISVGCSTSRPL